MDNSTVYFYDTESALVRKEDIYLNNFDVTPFVADDDFMYPTVEHYYQAHKFDNFEDNKAFKSIFEEIRTSPDALKAKKLARHYEKDLEGKWQKNRWHAGYKDTIMKRALIYKFYQNNNLLEKLLATDDKRLVEASDKDPYWGGLMPDSKNRLGDLLMAVRDNYKTEKKIFIEGSGLDKME